MGADIAGVATWVRVWAGENLSRTDPAQVRRAGRIVRVDMPGRLRCVILPVSPTYRSSVRFPFQALAGPEDLPEVADPLSARSCQPD
jgi:hypothetical protein